MIGSCNRLGAVMTIRESLTKKKRKVSIIAFAAWIIFAFGSILNSKHYAEMSIFIPTFVIFMACVAYLLFGIRCPKCKGIMGYVISYTSSPFSISKKINYCPYCGQDLNKEVDNNSYGGKVIL
jgi:exosortase/archaeosortase